MAPDVISTVEKVLFLKGVDLFRTIPGEELSSIAQICSEEEYDPEEKIITEGDEGDAMFLIVLGDVKVHSGEQVFATLKPKQWFGEMALFDSEPRSANVTTVSPVVVLRLEQEGFSELLSEKPDISREIIRVLTQRLREANKR